MTTKSSDNGYKEGYQPNLALLGHVNYKKITVYLNFIKVSLTSIKPCSLNINYQLKGQNIATKN